MSHKNNNRAFVGMESLESRQLMSAGLPVSDFGTNGQVNTHVVGSVYQEQVQSDGKVLLFSTGQAGMPQVTRFNANGALDTTYATGGTDGNGVLTPVGTPTAVALQSNDKLIVAGSLNGLLMAARYNANGTLDTSYGTNGISTVKSMTSFGKLNSETAYAVIVDSANRAVVLDEGIAYGTTLASLVRFNPTGSVDSSFNDFSVHTGTSVGIFNAPLAAGAIAQAPDKSYIAMTSSDQRDNGGDFNISRINDTGAISSHKFYDIGAAFGLPQTTAGSVTSLAVTAANKIVFGGSVGGHFDGPTYVPGTAIVGRFTSSLDLDPTFNGGVGFQDLSFNANQVSRAIPQADGKILIAATSDNGNLTLQRLNNNGSSDTTFGEDDGIAPLDLYGDANSDATLLPNGQILVAASNVKYSMVLEKYTNDVGGISGTIKVGANGLAGQVVYIDNNNNGQLDSTELRTLTNASGQYNFLGLKPGNYKLRQALTAGYAQSQPTGNAGISATVTADQLASGKNFTDIVVASNHVAANTFSASTADWLKAVLA